MTARATKKRRSLKGKRDALRQARRAAAQQWLPCPEPYRALFFEPKDDALGEVYYASKTGADSYTVRNLPVFSATKRFNKGSGAVDHFDEAWLNQAIATARRRAPKYAAPVHLDHTDDDGRKVPRLAGYLTNLRMGKAEVDGADRPTIYADIQNVPGEVFREMERGRLGYRSVEINNPRNPDISSLALLATVPPFFKFPISRVQLENTEHPDTSPRFCESAAETIAVVFPGRLRFQEAAAMPKQPDEALVEGTDPKQHMMGAPPFENEGDNDGGGDQEGAADSGESAPEHEPPQQMDSGASPAEPSTNAMLMQILQLLQAQAAPAPAPAMPAAMPPAMPPGQAPPPVPAPVTASEKGMAMSDPTLPPAVAAKFAEYERQLVELNRGLERQERRRLIEDGRQKLVNFAEHRVGAGGMETTLRVDMPAVQHFLDGESGVLRHLPTKDIEAFFDSYLQVAPKVAFVADTEAGATGAPGTTAEGDVAAAQKFSEDFQAAAEQDDDFAQRFAEVANNFDPADASDRAFVAAASARFDAFDKAAQKAFGPSKFEYTVRQYNAAQETSQAG